VAAFDGLDVCLVVIPHQFGFGEWQRFPLQLVPELEKKGNFVHFGTMLFHTEDLYGVRAPQVMANLLRRLVSVDNMMKSCQDFMYC
jgi:hypothetical protein